MYERKGPSVALLIIASLVGGVVATSCATAGAISDAKVVRWVEKTVAERQATAEDKRFDEIGWVTDVRTAIELGTKHNRPIFYYHGDGRINTGRC